MVVAYHLGRCLEMECGRQWFSGWVDFWHDAIGILGTKPRSPDKRKSDARSTLLALLLQARRNALLCSAATSRESLGARGGRPTHSMPCHMIVYVARVRCTSTSSSKRSYTQTSQAMRAWPRNAAP